ncbi:NUDIX domain-containing protein [Patescibacteria group bacterium]|nr:NUDIX domain-containing protein [Patescibacteria group bacterium]
MERNNKESKNLEYEDFLNLGVAVNNRGEVLLIRWVEPEVGKDGSVLTWAFPGSGQRLNETREECVKRGILAKTGYDVESIKQISLRSHPQFPVFIVYHLCRLVSPEQVAKPNKSHEVAEIRWVKLEEIKNLIKTDIDPKVSRELGLR